ncbi:unnamed protein product [Dicrocoelium dendriticum]|nr:unnamed protein product [Dicrocoelium dendriticum]
MLLRRTGVFTEQELRLKFLQTRNACLENQLHLCLTAPRISEPVRLGLTDTSDSFISPVTTGGFRNSNRPHYDAYWRATRRVEVTRVQLFDIITQYRAVFFDEESTTWKKDLEAADGKLNSFLVNPLCLSDETQGDVSRGGYHLFNAWLVHRISTFLNTLTSDIKEMLYQPHLSVQEVVDRWSGSNFKASGTDSSPHLELDTIFTQMQSLLSQTMYFGRSLGRFGCDFRPHLSDLFLTCILDFVEVYLRNASDEFTIAIDNVPWKVDASPSDADTTCFDPKATTPSELTSSLPCVLISYPPLALLYNSFMDLFNGLRFCCPVALRHSLITSVSDCLSTCCTRILTAYRSLVGQKTIEWRTEVVDFAAHFATEMVPKVLTHLIIQLLCAASDASGGMNSTEISHLVVHRLSRQICAPIHETWPRILSVSMELELPLETANLSELKKSEADPIPSMASADTMVDTEPCLNGCTANVGSVTDTIT